MSKENVSQRTTAPLYKNILIKAPCIGDAWIKSLRKVIVQGKAITDRNRVAVGEVINIFLAITRPQSQDKIVNKFGKKANTPDALEVAAKAACNLAANLGPDSAEDAKAIWQTVIELGKASGTEDGMQVAERAKHYLSDFI